MLQNHRTKLESILIKRGLTQTDLYNLIVDSGYKALGKDRINRIISGEHTNYNMKTLTLLTSVLNVTPNDIVEYETN